MLQRFIRLTEFAEFTELLFHLGKTPLSLTKLLDVNYLSKDMKKITLFWKVE